MNMKTRTKGKKGGGYKMVGGLKESKTVKYVGAMKKGKK